MATIPLRQYNREIEGMIDSGQIDEAIAHCRHILQSYPKHIQTYRLLGKTYLESQRYTDASDIFQRLLAVVPDDFVSHVGMSIIREDENNLDAAIWHMERAFETQPSNAAIQEELRRLYGRRDGMEPPKIRLTRGALARMYARGNLYEQAIAELRSALAEDPQRVDLQVLLAQMYYYAGQRVDSIDICNNIIKKYPYCLEANRLLVATLPEVNRTQDAEDFHQRLIALDPYLTSAPPNAVNSDDVPENAINIERLIYRTGQAVSGVTEQPAWASSLGVAFEKDSAEQLPEWLQEDESPALKAGEASVPVEAAPFSWETPEEKTDIIPETPTQEEEIPEWMKDAGWQPSTGQAVEGPLTFDEEETEAEITKGELPDWLKGMAPAGALEEELPPLESENEGEAVLPWLQEKEPGPTDTIISWLEETKPEEKSAASAEPTKSGLESELPDWMREETAPESSAPVAEQPKAEEEEIPSWLADLEQAKEKPSGITDWLQSSALPVEPTPSTEPAPGEVVSSVPPDLADQDAALAWLESLAVQHGAKEEELITKPEERLETPPGWVQETAPEAPPAAISELPEAIEPAEKGELPDWLRDMESTEEVTPSPVSSTPVESAEEAELPDWLRSMAPPEEAAPTPTEAIPPSTEAAENTELPDWLLGMAPGEVELPPATAEPVEKFEVAEEAGLPDWLSELEANPEEISTPLPETPAAPTEETPTWMQEMEAVVPETPPTAEVPGIPTPDLASEDAALAWLESLAAQHGAKEEELITKPEDRLETPPEWVKESVVSESPVEEVITPTTEPEKGELPSWLEETAPEEAAPEPIAETPVEATPAEEVPAWLQEMAPEEAAPEPVTETPIEAAPAEELPAWLQEMAPEEAAPEPVTETPVEAAPAEELPAWLQEMAPEKAAPEPVVETPVEAAPAEELPAWLQEMASEEAAPEPVAETPIEAAPAELPVIPTTPNLTDEDAALAWLESLAAQHGAKEEELITKPEERLETPPDWVQESAVVETPDEEVTPLVEPEKGELPAWLQEMAPEEAAPEPVTEVPVEPVPAEEIPAWLQEMAPEETAPEPVAEVPVEPAPAEEIPAWLQEMASEETAPEPVIEVPAEPAPAEEIPAWLQEAAPEETAPEPVTELPAEPAPVEEIPAWLQEMAPEETTPEPVTEVPIELPPSEEIPAWLQEETKVVPIEQIDINTASLSQLERLPGVGFVLAQNILAHREAHGALRNLDELVNIPGISPDLVNNLRGTVTITAPEVTPIVPVAADIESILAEARKDMDSGQSALAASKYVQLVKKNQHLETVIRELQDALYHFPVDIDIWQTLGDAYMRNDNLQEALDAYTKAEELLR